MQLLVAKDDGNELHHLLALRYAIPVNKKRQRKKKTELNEKEETSNLDDQNCQLFTLHQLRAFLYFKL